MSHPCHTRDQRKKRVQKWNENKKAKESRRYTGAEETTDKSVSFIQGVSTRNVMDVVESLGVDNISVLYGEMFFRIIRRK